MHMHACGVGRGQGWVAGRGGSQPEVCRTRAARRNNEETTPSGTSLPFHITPREFRDFVRDPPLSEISPLSYQHMFGL